MIKEWHVFVATIFLIVVVVAVMAVLSTDADRRKAEQKQEYQAQCLAKQELSAAGDPLWDAGKGAYALNVRDATGRRAGIVYYNPMSGGCLWLMP